MNHMGGDKFKSKNKILFIDQYIKRFERNDLIQSLLNKK